MTDKQFDKFLEELNVVISDISAGMPQVAWKHYNDTIFDIHNKINHMTKDKLKGESNGRH